MSQVELELCVQEAEPADATGFRIGWDHAHHGLVPPPELLLDGSPVGEGWRAARAVFARRARTWPAGRHTRRWLALRIDAWRAGAVFDLATVTPNHLAQIEVRQCPARRVWLAGTNGAEDGGDAPTITRLNPQAAYSAGNLLMLSRCAAQTCGDQGVAELVRRARAAEAEEDSLSAVPGAVTPHRLAASPDAEPDADAEAPGERNARPGSALDAAAWWRLAALRSFATPLPLADAARLPLAALPPNRTRVLNAPQALQVLLTLRVAAADWSSHLREVAALLPAHSLRTDFNLWVGALAPRRLEAQALGRNMQRSLEDAWLAERVQRRWQHFVLSLGEPACETLVRQLASRRLGPRATDHVPLDQAVDGWSLIPSPRAAAASMQPLSAEAQPPWRDASRSEAGCAPATSAPARPAAPRRTARTPFAPRPRATAGLQPAAR